MTASGSRLHSMPEQTGNPGVLRITKAMSRIVLGFLAVLVALSAIQDARAQSRVTGGSARLDDIVNNATIKPPGTYRMAGRTLRCGNTDTIVSPRFWDYGGAMPGLIILNPNKLARLPRQVRLFVYYHECGHQYVDDDETAADCYAVRQGRRDGWLTPAGVKQICTRLFRNSSGDRFHAPGPARCSMLERCYADAAPRRDGEPRVVQRRIRTPRVDVR